MQETLNDTVGWYCEWKGSKHCGHYQAVPISDGDNIIFTDPEDGYLCLGHDAPPDIGATKLIRRYIFVGPKDAEGNAIVPRTYKSGGELRWGMRVVVEYEGRLWLFVVPSDEFAKEVEKTKSENDEQDAGGGPKKPKSTRIDGLEFGRVPNLVDIAVDSTGGNLTVWAFTMNGMAYVWQLGGGPQPIIRRIVLNDGTVISEKDPDGDTFMHGTSNPSRRAVQFDGSASAHPTISTNFGEQDRIIDTTSVMSVLGATSPEDEGYTSGGAEFEQRGGLFVSHVPPKYGRWTEDGNWVPYIWGADYEDIQDHFLGINTQDLGRCEVEILSSHKAEDRNGSGRWMMVTADIAR